MSETKNKDEEEKTENSGFTNFLTGAVVGAALTYLFTTESGRKIKDELLKEGTKLLENFGAEVEKAQVKLAPTEKKIVAKVEQKAESVQKQVGEAVQTAKDEVTETVSSISDKIEEEIPKQVEQLQKKGRHFFFAKKTHTSES
jgi:gas vesicle protein